MDSSRISLAGRTLEIPRPSLRLPRVSRPRLSLDMLGRSPSNQRIYAQIVGWGRYSPAHVLTNFELSRTLDTDDEWIRSRTGIAERRIAGPKECTSTMALHAARDALLVAGVSPRKIDLVIVATATPDQPVPATACTVQDEIGAPGAAAIDVNAGCAGFVYALALAAGMIGAGTHHYALVVGADTLSRITDYTDRNTCVIFADGAGAVLLTGTEQRTGLISYTLGCDGFTRDLVQVPAGGSRRPASHETVENREHFIRMRGQEVFRIAVDKMTKSAQYVIAEAGLRPEQLSLVIPHQANLRIIQAVTRALKVPEEKVFVNIERYGNTSAASLPIALVEAIEAGRVRQGDYLLFDVFGAGLTWGAAVVQWGVPAVVAHIPWWRAFLSRLNRGQRRLKALARRIKRNLDFRRWFYR